MMLGANISGVTASMTAFHTDPYMNEGTHQHTWHVTAFYPAKPFRDGRAIKAMLGKVLSVLPDENGLLPDRLWSQEDIAKAVLQLMTGSVFGVRITREEGFETWIWEQA
jgi:hypothetical protein